MYMLDFTQFVHALISLISNDNKKVRNLEQQGTYDKKNYRENCNMILKWEEHPTVRRHCGSQIAFFAGGPSHAILFRTIVMVRRVISTRQLQKKRVDRKFLRHFKLKGQVKYSSVLF